MSKRPDPPIESRVLNPPAEYPSLQLFYPTLALKMSGHGVAACLLGCRPREISITAGATGYGTYDSSLFDKSDNSAIIAFAGHAALTIGHFKKMRLAKGFRQSAFTIDFHRAVESIDPDQSDNDRLLDNLRVYAHVLLAREWSAVMAVARQLLRQRRMDGESLGKLVDANLSSASLHLAATESGDRTGVHSERASP